MNKNDPEDLEDLEDLEDTKRQKHKAPKFRDYYDDNFNKEDNKEFHKRKKKLGKNPRVKKNKEQNWPTDY